MYHDDGIRSDPNKVHNHEEENDVLEPPADERKKYTSSKSSPSNDEKPLKGGLVQFVQRGYE